MVLKVEGVLWVYLFGLWWCVVVLTLGNHHTSIGTGVMITLLIQVSLQFDY